MAMMKVELSIGYPTAKHVDVIEIDDNELEECKSDEEREEICHQYWQDWANNYIDGHYEMVDA